MQNELTMVDLTSQGLRKHKFHDEAQTLVVLFSDYYATQPERSRCGSPRNSGMDLILFNMKQFVIDNSHALPDQVANARRIRDGRKEGSCKPSSTMIWDGLCRF